MTQQERDTYIDGREIIDRAVAYLTRVSDALARVREQGGHSERTAMLLSTVEPEQRELLGNVKRFLEKDASSKALQTYVQYVLELPDEVEPPQSPVDTLSLVQWLQEHNGRLCREFREIAEKGGSKEQQQAFATLADHIEAHEKTLSKEYQRLQDL